MNQTLYFCWEWKQHALTAFLMHRVKDTKKITGREMNEQPVLACIHTRDSACIIQETYLFLDLDWAVVEIFCSLSLQNKKYSESFQTLPHVCCYCTKTSMSADKADKHINPSVSPTQCDFIISVLVLIHWLKILDAAWLPTGRRWCAWQFPFIQGIHCATELRAAEYLKNRHQGSAASWKKIIFFYFIAFPDCELFYHHFFALHTLNHYHDLEVIWCMLRFFMSRFLCPTY